MDVNLGGRPPGAVNVLNESTVAMELWHFTVPAAAGLYHLFAALTAPEGPVQCPVLSAPGRYGIVWVSVSVASSATGFPEEFAE